MTHTTIAEVRRISSVTSTDKASNDDVMDAIIEAEQQFEKELGASFTPIEILENLDGNGTYRIFVSRNPLLAVRRLIIDDTEITLNGNIFFKKPSGKIELNLNSSPETSRFKKGTEKIAGEYVHGWLEHGNKSTKLTSASNPGTGVDLSVTSESGFSKNDWVEIYGMDKNHEATKITAVSTNQITVDSLSFSHENESRIVKLEVSEVIKKLIPIPAKKTPREFSIDQLILFNEPNDARIFESNSCCFAESSKAFYFVFLSMYLFHLFLKNLLIIYTLIFSSQIKSFFVLNTFKKFKYIFRP